MNPALPTPAGGRTRKLHPSSPQRNLLLGVWTGFGLAARHLPASWRVDDPRLAAYFEAEVTPLESRDLAEGQTLSDWTEACP